MQHPVSFARTHLPRVLRRCFYPAPVRQYLSIQGTISVAREPDFINKERNTLVSSISSKKRRWDVVGLGQAMIDYSASVDEQVLQKLMVAKGGRRVISIEERAATFELLDQAGCPSQVSAGGSLANTLVGIARLAKSYTSSDEFRVCMAASVGNDVLGRYFCSQMHQASVLVQPAELEDSNAAYTGTVMVLTTKDAQRSFLSYFSSDPFPFTEQVIDAISSSRCLVIEGYMWELPGARAMLSQAVQLARAAGSEVVLTAGDATVVARNVENILHLMSLGVDTFFLNTTEAAELLGMGASVESAGPTFAVDAARALGSMCSMVMVTDGSRGSVVYSGGEIHIIPPHWTKAGPVDTCGAGDAYAAGLLMAKLQGHDIRTSAEFGARVASTVISDYRPQLSERDAAQLVTALPVLEPTVAPLLMGVGEVSFS